jgi:zinc protease
MAQVLKTGTKSHTKEQIQDMLDQWKSNVNLDMAKHFCKFQHLQRKLPKVTSLIKEILTESTFPEAELVKTVNEYNTYLESSLNDPQSIAFSEIERITEIILKKASIIHLLHRNRLITIKSEKRTAGRFLQQNIGR